MQSEGKTRTYIVTVAEQAQEQPVAQSDQKSGIVKCYTNVVTGVANKI